MEIPFPPDKIKPQASMLSTCWLCSTCKILFGSAEPARPPSPCYACGGVAFEKIAQQDQPALSRREIEAETIQCLQIARTFVELAGLEAEARHDDFDGDHYLEYSEYCTMQESKNLLKRIDAILKVKDQPATG